MSQINLDREHEDTVRNSYLESSPGAVFPVLGFGDAETEECLPVVGLPQASCFDIVLSIDYEFWNRSQEFPDRSNSASSVPITMEFLSGGPSR